MSKLSTQYTIRFPAQAERHIPVVRVSFHTENACYQAKGEAVGVDAEMDPTNQVLSVTTQKSLGSPAGAFTLQLAGLDWLEKVKAQDIVVISMGYKSESDKNGLPKLDTVMVGLVDRVARYRTMGEGSPQVSTTITGRDFGKVLIKSQLKFYPELGQADKSKEEKFFLTEDGWIALMNFFTNENITKGTPAVVLDNIMRHILQKLNDVSWTVWDESGKAPKQKKVKIGNVLRYDFGKVDMFLPMILTADQFEGSLWNLMERTSIKPFTELFVDVREDSESWNNKGLPRVVPETIEESSAPHKATIAGGDIMKGAYPSPRFSFGDDKSAVMVVYRNTPFDKPTWESLYTHTVKAVDVLDENLSQSDDEHYNLFWAGTTINPFGLQNLKAISPPLFNENQAKRYGLCPLEVNVEGLAIDESDPTHRTLLETLSKSFSAKLKAWFEFNHTYWNGPMTVRGKGSYKIGQRLIAPGIEKEFYIEGVTQTFNVFDNWTTTLDLTRGMWIGDAPDHTKYLPKRAEAPEKPSSAMSDEEVRQEYYTVKRGDTITSIAVTVYGSASKWTLIWEANKDVLIQRDSRNSTQHGRWIYPGQVLRIPKE